jgi:N-methylhydantoinase A
LQAVGATERPDYPVEDDCGEDAGGALKGIRSAYIPEKGAFASVVVYDGHRLRCGNRIAGPALIETVTTTVLVSESFDCMVDRYRSFVLYRKGSQDLVGSTHRTQVEEARV